MADFEATCDNTEQIGTDAEPWSFQVWDKNGNPARLDTVNDTLKGTASGGGAIVILPETVGANGAPQYNFVAKSGSLDTEEVDLGLDCDGQPGPGIVNLHLSGVLHVAPVPAVSAAFATPAASKKV